MPVTFLHTADWQLGKPFASIRDESKRNRLQQERLQCIRNLGKIASETKASFILVAGDLFDSSQATKTTVSAACSAIGSLGIPVLAIPGNHDHAGPGSIWDQDFFKREQEQLAPNLRVLTAQEPVILPDAIILPAPLLRRHEPGDPTSWIRAAVSEIELPADLPRIVLAHGTIQGFGSTQEDDDGETTVMNWIDLSSLPEEHLDFIALGDWHGTKQIHTKAWYSGTPEIDRFPKGEGNDPGNVLQVTVARSTPPLVEKIQTGRFTWKEMNFRFSDDESLDLFSTKLDEIIGNSGDESLLRLTLEGSLGINSAGRLEKLLESLDSRLIRLKLDNRVTIAPSEEEMIALTQRSGDPLISSVASQLVADLQGNAEDAAIARLALRELHAALA
ncbi:MAG: DNA repair exonuclease [Verrucomicrobia bacterium]|jgi:DNA repair exonuclease SbcCD nuclease subunit|nr:DNA repair exonuclease [Verrucomicrobiota bacterium]|tara:strand:- start:37426 stop:38592 length:1167 start_codon:yes stop_codon:yes gene_type:complete